jgi:hypothetical protein
LELKNQTHPMKPDVRSICSIKPASSLRRSLVCGLLLTVAAAAQAQTFYSTRAGYAGQQSANGTGTNALFYEPAGAAVDGSGNTYVADFSNHTIEKITPAGLVTTLAGSAGNAGSSNGTGTNALFNGPEGLAVDVGGNVYVADSGNNLIRKITSSGVVTTLAGSAGNPGSANGTGTNAFFNQPAGVAVDGSSNVFVADYGNHTIRKITPAGAVTTLAGSAGNFGSTNGLGANALFYQPQGVAVDTFGNVFVADTANDLVREISTLGTVTTLAGSAGNFGSTNATGTNALFNAPTAVAVDHAGNVYVADTGNNTIRMITSLGVVSTVAGSAGNAGSRNATGTNALFWGPVAITADSATNLYVADYFNGTIRKVTPAKVVDTLAGSASNDSKDGPGANARFSLPQSLAADSSGNIFVADAANDTIRKITSAGIVSTFAGQAGNPGSANGSGTNAQFYGPQAVAVDSGGNVYVADTANHTIRKITSAGAVSTLAGLAGSANNFDGTGASAQFYAPQGIAVDGAGNVYVSDTLNYTIRQITPGGAVTTLAGVAGTFGSTDGTNSSALFGWPKGLALDSSTNLYVADYLNHTIRQITPAGVVTTVAGLAGISGNADGTNSSARFFEPEAVAVDGAGSLYVLDSGNQTIRKITPAGTNWVVTTVAGQPGTSGGSDGFMNSVLFNFPAGITFNSAGNLVVADSGNNTIRLAGVQPVISNLAVQPRPSSAIITWTTVIPSSSQVAFGPTMSYGALSTLDSSLVTSHAVLLTGLSANQVYNFQAISQTGSGQSVLAGSFSTDLTLILQSQQAAYSGSWTTDNTAPDRYSPTYKYAAVAPAAPAASAVFQPLILTPGQYDVYYWYSAAANRSLAAPVTASFQGGAVSINVNETVNGGSWHLITTNQTHAAGTNAFVTLGNNTGETGRIVIADAVKWVYTSGQDLPANGNVPAWWANYYYGVNTINASNPAANGYSILNDYILGIAPNDPNTFLSFSLGRTTNGFQAVFSPWMGGRIYQLQSTTNLAGPVWQTLTNLSVTQNQAGQGVIAGTNNNSMPTFYRLSVQLSP